MASTSSKEKVATPSSGRSSGRTKSVDVLDGERANATVKLDVPEATAAHGADELHRVQA